MKTLLFCGWVVLTIIATPDCRGIIVNKDDSDDNTETMTLVAVAEPSHQGTSGDDWQSNKM
jgi:hypothetical protein